MRSFTLASGVLGSQTTRITKRGLGTPPMTWTEILHIAGPALSFAAVVVGFVTWLFMRHIRGLERQRRFAENQRDNLQSKFNRAQASLEKLAQYRAAYRDLKERNEELT